MSTDRPTTPGRFAAVLESRSLHGTVTIDSAYHPRNQRWTRVSSSGQPVSHAAIVRLRTKGYTGIAVRVDGRGPKEFDVADFGVENLRTVADAEEADR